MASSVGTLSDRPDVTVTIVSWNTADLLRACLRSLGRGARRATIDAHVVDNGSTDGSPQMVRDEFPGVRLIENNENLGFARAVNRSWAHAKGRYWLLLNSDATTGEGAIDELMWFMDRHPRAGLATARLLGPDGSPQHCAQRVPTVPLVLLEASRLHKLLAPPLRGRLLLGPYFGYDVEQEVGWTWGAALMARREAVEQVGLLSDRFFMYGEDLEWCLRMHSAGWQVWFCPAAEVTHQGAASAPPDQSGCERRAIILERIFEAMALHRGPVRMAALHAATALIGGAEWITGRTRHRPTTMAGETVRFHLKAARASLSTSDRHR